MAATDDNDDGDVYMTSSGDVLHKRRDCPALESVTTPIREYRRERAPDRPWCAHCGGESVDAHSPRELACPYCDETVEGGGELRVHVRDNHPNE